MSEEETKEYTVSTSRIDKHIILNDSITSIYKVKEKVNDLLLHITDKDEPDKTSELINTKVNIPSLEEVLNDSPDRIDKICEETIKIIEDIKARLF